MILLTNHNSPTNFLREILVRLTMILLISLMILFTRRKRERPTEQLVTFTQKKILSVPWTSESKSHLAKSSSPPRPHLVTSDLNNDTIYRCDDKRFFSVLLCDSCCWRQWWSEIIICLIPVLQIWQPSQWGKWFWSKRRCAKGASLTSPVTISVTMLATTEFGFNQQLNRCMWLY